MSIRETLGSILLDYNEEILSILKRDGRDFFDLPYSNRERYVLLADGLCDKILALLKEEGWLSPEEVAEKNK